MSFDKPFRFVIDIENFDFESGESAPVEGPVYEVEGDTVFDGPTTSMVLTAKADDSVNDWFRKVITERDREPAKPYTRDLVLRPTTMQPGIYEDEDGDPFMVADYNGSSHLLFWIDDASASELAPGDTVLKGCYIKSHTVDQA